MDSTFDDTGEVPSRLLAGIFKLCYEIGYQIHVPLINRSSQYRSFIFTQTIFPTNVYSHVQQYLIPLRQFCVPLAIFKSKSLLELSADCQPQHSSNLLLPLYPQSITTATLNFGDLYFYIYVPMYIFVHPPQLRYLTPKVTKYSSTGHKNKFGPPTARLSQIHVKYATPL